VVAQSANEDIGQHLQPIDEIELLEDHIDGDRTD
jgi:hypothetical protein